MNEIAEELFFKDLPENGEFKTREQYEKHMKNVAEATAIYTKICNITTFDEKETPRGLEQKYQALISFMKYIPEEGTEILISWRDTLNFFQKEREKKISQYTKCSSLLKRLCCEREVDSHQRLLTAIRLYNLGEINILPCFESIATDPLSSFNEKTESCKYLFAIDEGDSREIVKKIITDMFSIQSCLSFINSFIFKESNGLKCIYNKVCLVCSYDNDFALFIQKAFFNDKNNDKKERILSAQNILNIESDENEREIIISKLFEISSDTTEEENTRADCLDIICRCGTDSDVKRARKDIKEIGYSLVNKNNSNILTRVKTIYNNSQNVHDLEEKNLEEFAEKMSVSEIRERNFDEIINEVSRLIEKYSTNQENKFMAKKSINRMKEDSAVFTQYKVSMAEIFSFVYQTILTFDSQSDMRILLEKILVDELVAMQDTCSSGHALRFVCVLSATGENTVKLSFDDQIQSNISGRITSKIQKIEDGDKRDSVSMGMLDDASEEDKIIYKEFIEATKQELFEELRHEFVNGGFVSNEEFEKSFKEGIEKWEKMIQGK